MQDRVRVDTGLTKRRWPDRDGAIYEPPLEKSLVLPECQHELRAGRGQVELGLHFLG
jgi:hypothetical protein